TSKVQDRLKVLELIALHNKIVQNIAGIKKEMALFKEVIEKITNTYLSYMTEIYTSDLLGETLKDHSSLSLQQQCLNQKSAEYNEAKRLFMGLTDLDYKPGHKEHTFYKYWLTSNGHTNSSDRNDTALLDAYQPEEIYSQYIIRMTGKGYTVIDYPNSEKITREDLLSRILVACADALSLIPD
ncbi:9710_t:CDS:2, partial [Gigaspora margarita]